MIKDELLKMVATKIKDMVQAEVAAIKGAVTDFLKSEADKSEQARKELDRQAIEKAGKMQAALDEMHQKHEALLKSHEELHKSHAALQDRMTKQEQRDFNVKVENHVAPSPVPVEVHPSPVPVSVSPTPVTVEHKPTEKAPVPVDFEVYYDPKTGRIKGGRAVPKP